MHLFCKYAGIDEIIDRDPTQNVTRPKTHEGEHRRQRRRPLHDFPGSLNTVYDARVFCEGFFAEYHHIHRHCGIGWHTPASVHFGTADAIDDAHQFTLDTAYPTPNASPVDP